MSDEPKVKRVLSAEHRAKIGAANSKRVVSAETRAKLSAVNRNRVMSAETRAKIGDAKRGKPGKSHSDETRAKISAAKLGAGYLAKPPLSDEHRAKISKSAKRRCRPGRVFSIRSWDDGLAELDDVLAE